MNLGGVERTLSELLLAASVGIVALVSSDNPEAVDYPAAAAVVGGQLDNCPENPTEGDGTSCKEPETIVIDRCIECLHTHDANGVSYYKTCIITVTSKVCGGHDGPGRPAPICYHCSKPSGGEDNSFLYTSDGGDQDFCDDLVTSVPGTNCSRDYAHAFENGEDPNRLCTGTGGPGGGL